LKNLPFFYGSKKTKGKFIDKVVFFDILKLPNNKGSNFYETEKLRLF
jgi:hypothetical protein